MKSLQETFDTLLQNIPKETQLANQLKGVVSSKIVQSRINTGMTQEQLAEKLGLTQPSLSKWENGDQNFTIEQICKICVLLDIDYRDIFMM